VAEIPESARQVLESGRLAHLVTIDPDGAPQVSCVWVGIEEGEIVCASLGPRRKLDNIARDPRVALSIETDEVGRFDLLHYLVVHGTARITEGGGAELLQRLAYVYLGPGVKFPPMDDPPPGVVVRIAPQRFGGAGPWTS
jgi:PPOX class probable F420-dependent enzyme